jgi:hypothetical protein
MGQFHTFTFAGDKHNQHTHQNTLTRSDQLYLKQGSTSRARERHLHRPHRRHGFEPMAFSASFLDQSCTRQSTLHHAKTRSDQIPHTNTKIFIQKNGDASGSARLIPRPRRLYLHILNRIRSLTLDLISMCTLLTDHVVPPRMNISKPRPRASTRYHHSHPMVSITVSQHLSCTSMFTPFTRPARL